jgi:hypothetical protein
MSFLLVSLNIQIIKDFKRNFRSSRELTKAEIKNQDAERCLTQLEREANRELPRKREQDKIESPRDCKRKERRGKVSTFPW